MEKQQSQIPNVIDREENDNEMYEREPRDTEMTNLDETDSESEWNGNYSRNYCLTDFNRLPSESENEHTNEYFFRDSIMNKATNRVDVRLMVI